MENNIYFGGVEGGATQSNLVICDGTGKVIGSAKGPNTNHWVLGIEECAQRILGMLAEAKLAAGLADQPLESLALTLSGCEQDTSNAELAARMKEQDAAKNVYVASDTIGSLFTGAPNGGMVLIAGTGSNALLRTSDGKHYNCGGWGYMLGDEGSGYSIAHRAVKTIFDDEDGFKPAQYSTNKVWQVIKEHFGIETRNDLLTHIYKEFDKSHFASLAAKLAHIATQGDELSLNLFYKAGRELANHVVALLRRGEARGSERDSVRIVCVGSVWKSWPLLKSGLLSELVESQVTTELEFVGLQVSSAMGAVWLAAKQVNVELPRHDSAYCEVIHLYRPHCASSYGDAIRSY